VDDVVHGNSAEHMFLKYGGYVHFNRACEVVGTNSIAPAPFGSSDLVFGHSQDLPSSIEDALTRQGRFQEITLTPLAAAGATHFAWIRPTEFSEVIASTDGCFAYKFGHETARYFPVVSKPLLCCAGHGFGRRAGPPATAVVEEAPTLQVEAYRLSRCAQYETGHRGFSLLAHDADVAAACVRGGLDARGAIARRARSRQVRDDAPQGGAESEQGGATVSVEEGSDDGNCADAVVQLDPGGGSFWQWFSSAEGA